MNAINFIDGLDGLVAGVALIANGVFFLYTLPARAADVAAELLQPRIALAIVLVGASRGILPLNWHPAKLFMGDAGSMLIGMLMATPAISVTGS